MTANAWQARAAELAKFTIETMVNRSDAWGQYNGTSAITAKGKLDVATIEHHFKGGPIIGLHVISVDQTCCWYCWDWDRHDGDPEEFIERNMRQAVEVVAKLERLGMHPLLEDSNGNGGLHIWLLLSEPRLARDVRAWAVSICPDADVELFPKQDHVESGGFGNWMRLPGRHPKNGHWSRFHVGGEWYEGSDAVDLFLGWDASDSSIIPIRAEPEPLPGGIAELRQSQAHDIDQLPGVWIGSAKNTPTTTTNGSKSAWLCTASTQASECSKGGTNGAGKAQNGSRANAKPNGQPSRETTRNL